MFGLDFESPEVSMTDLNENNRQNWFQIACF